MHRFGVQICECKDQSKGTRATTSTVLQAHALARIRISYGPNPRSAVRYSACTVCSVMSGLSELYRETTREMRVMEADDALRTLIATVYDLVFAGQKDLQIDSKIAREAAVAALNNSGGGGRSGVVLPALRIRNMTAFMALFSIFQTVSLPRNRMDCLERICNLMSDHSDNYWLLQEISALSLMIELLPRVQTEFKVLILRVNTQTHTSIAFAFVLSCDVM